MNVDPSLKLEIVPQSLDVQAADVIRAQILQGNFPPGYRLVESRLAEQLNLSRGTIRSALQQLTHEGLVNQVQYKSWSVATFSLQDTWELYTLRNVLEGFAARLAAEAITLERATLLKAALEQFNQAIAEKDLQKVIASDFALHKTIVQITGHQRLQAQYKLIEQQIYLTIAICDPLYQDLNELKTTHERLVEAICSGNGDYAEQMSREHSADGKEFLPHLQGAHRSRKVQTKNIAILPDS
jgi:DNA-binding GntR family transcriptional regulator